MKTQNVSFKGCIPVEFYAKYSKTGSYVPVVKPENVKKCQNFVIRNLNNTAGSNQNDEFVREYKKVDKDYAREKKARGVYNGSAPIIKSIHDRLPFYSYVITGKDADTIEAFGELYGYQKKEIFDRTGSNNNAETQEISREYRNKVKNYVNSTDKRVKDENRNGLVMQVYFTPKFNKKGEIAKFSYDKVAFYPQERM